MSLHQKNKKLYDYEITILQSDINLGIGFDSFDRYMIAQIPQYSGSKK